MIVTQVPLTGVASACVGVAALAVVAPAAGWRVIRHFTVMAHEGGHAVAGMLLLRDVGGIVLNADATGATRVGSAGFLGDIVIAFAGYAGPSAFGLGAAELIKRGYISTVLWVTLFLLAVLLLSLHASFGRRTVAAAGGLVFLVARYAPASAQVIGAYAITWLLLFSAVRRVLEVGTGSSDGDNLRGMTHLPRFLWFLLWLCGTLVAAVAGGRLLLQG